MAAAPDFDAYQSRAYFRNLDGLRCLCIAMVLWHHALPHYETAFEILSRGFLGFDFFFVLSGFLITTLLLRERTRYGEFSLKNFYIRRAIRILPVYLFVVTAVSAYFILVKGDTHYLEILPYYYLFLSNFIIDHMHILNVTWSLSMEEQYYLLWRLVLMLVLPRWYVPLALVLIAVNVVIVMGITGLQPLRSGPLVFAMPTSTYAPLIIGSLVAIALNQRRGFNAMAQLAGGWFTLLATCLVLLILVESLPEDLRGVPNLLIHVTMALLLVSIVVREDNVLTRVLANPAVARIGVVSYGIYLYHLIALHVVHAVIDPQNVFGVLVLYSVLSWIMAEISYRTLEAWFRRFRPVEVRRPLPSGPALKDAHEEAVRAVPGGRERERA